MADKEKARERGTALVEQLISGAKAGMSEHINLSDALKRGRTEAQPEGPKHRHFVRDIEARIKQAKEEVAADTIKNRKRYIDKKIEEIHTAMDERYTDMISARISGYDVCLQRDPGEHHGTITMKVNGSNIQPEAFREAVAEVAGLNNGPIFEQAQQMTHDIREQVDIQAPRTAVAGSIRIASEAAKAPVKHLEKNGKLANQMLGMLLRLALRTLAHGART